MRLYNGPTGDKKRAQFACDVPILLQDLTGTWVAFLWPTCNPTVVIWTQSHVLGPFRQAGINRYGKARGDRLYCTWSVSSGLSVSFLASRKGPRLCDCIARCIRTRHISTLDKFEFGCCCFFQNKIDDNPDTAHLPRWWNSLCILSKRGMFQMIKTSTKKHSGVDLNQ